MGMFDDLVPQGGSKPKVGMFDDLVPAQPVQAQPTAPRGGIPDQFEAGARFLRQAPYAPEGAVGAIPGLPGDVEKVGRGVAGFLSRALPQQSIAARVLSMVSPDNALPTSTQTTDEMFGEAKSEDQKGGRVLGSAFTPLGAKAGALEEGAKIAAAKGAAIATARQMAATPGAKADEILARSLERDKLSPENAAQALQQFGDKPVTVADIAGNATARKARLVNTLEGQGSDRMATFLSDRQAAQHGRVLEDIGANLAGGGDIYSMGKRMMAERDARSRPLYRDAYAANENMTSPELEAILSTDAGKAALEGARKMMRNSRLPMGEAERAVPEIVADSGKVTNMGGPDKGKSLFQTIRQLGGIKTHDAQGFITREGGEVRHAIKDVRTSGIVNNKGGLTPDKMREALRERGWFGERADQGADIDEFYQALRSGEMQHPNVSGASNAAEANARNLDEVRDLADDLGVYYGRNWNADQINQAVNNAERSAMATGGEQAGRNLQTLDYVKRAFDDQISAAQRGGAKNEARILTDLKRGLVSELDRLDTSGKYAQARATYSGPSQSVEALESGGDFLKMSSGEIADTIKGMGEADQQFFRVGAAQKLRDMVDAAKDNADAARRIFGDKATRDRITAVFGKDAADKMAQSMRAENMMTTTNQTARGNSTSMNKAAEIAEAGGGGAVKEAAKDAVKGFAVGGPLGAVTLPAVNLMERGASAQIERFFNRMPPDVRTALAQRLTATGPDAQQMLVDLLSSRNAIQNARIVPGGGANIPRIDPRVIGALLLGGSAAKMGQQ